MGLIDELEGGITNFMRVPEQHENILRFAAEGPVNHPVVMFQSSAKAEDISIFLVRGLYLCLDADEWCPVL